MPTMDQQNGVYLYNEILFSNKKKLTTDMCYGMNIKIVMLSRISQQERSHIEWFNLYETARKSKSVETVSTSVISWSWRKEWELTEGRLK